MLVADASRLPLRRRLAGLAEAFRRRARRGAGGLPIDVIDFQGMALVVAGPALVTRRVGTALAGRASFRRYEPEERR